MITVTVLYPKTNESHFDFDYYLQIHTPLVKARFGPLGMEGLHLLRGSGSLAGGPPDFAMIARLDFTSLPHLQQALTQHGAEIMSDIPKFTNVQPIIQMNEPI